MVKTQNRFRDLTGKSFGRLIVLERDWGKTSPANKWKVYWKCKCICGNIRSIRSEHLKLNGKSHHTLSCGCLQKEKARENGKKNILPPGEYSKRCLYHDYKTRAKGKNLTFSLSRDIFDNLINQECFYCGNTPSNKHKHCRRKTEELMYNGIDRKNSKKGYDIDNVVPCCSDCNYAKGNMEEQYFYKWISKTYSHLKMKEII